MRVQIYDKAKDAWLDGTVKTATVQADDKETYVIYGDNIRYPGQDGSRCQVCGQSREDKAGERLFILSIVFIAVLGAASLIKYLFT